MTTNTTLTRTDWIRFGCMMDLLHAKRPKPEIAEALTMGKSSPAWQLHKVRQSKQ